MGGREGDSERGRPPRGRIVQVAGERGLGPASPRRNRCGNGTDAAVCISEIGGKGTGDEPGNTSFDRQTLSPPLRVPLSLPFLPSPPSVCWSIHISGRGRVPVIDMCPAPSQSCPTPSQSCPCPPPAPSQSRVLPCSESAMSRAGLRVRVRGSLVVPVAAAVEPVAYHVVV